MRDEQLVVVLKEYLELVKEKAGENYVPSADHKRVASFVKLIDFNPYEKTPGQDALGTLIVERNYDGTIEYVTDKKILDK